MPTTLIRPRLVLLAAACLLIAAAPSLANERGRQGAHRMQTISFAANAEGSEMLAFLRRSMREAAAAGATEKELKALASSLQRDAKAFIKPYQQMVGPYQNEVMRALKNGPSEGRKEASDMVKRAAAQTKGELSIISSALQNAVREELNIAVVQIRAQQRRR